LEVDLRVLTLPGTVITFEELLSKEIPIATEVSNIQLLKADFGALCLPPNKREPQSILSSCVVIVKNSIPVEYITNYDAMSEEYSSSLPF